MRRSHPLPFQPWAVIVSTSRFWFNYRHAAKALTFYHIVRQNGIPDSNIILMLSDDIPCNARNRSPASVFNNMDHEIDLYSPDVEVDNRGYDVTVLRFLRLLQDRWDPAAAALSRRPCLTYCTPRYNNLRLGTLGEGGVYRPVHFMLHWVVMRRKVLADGGGAAQPHQAHADKSAVDVAAPAGVDKAGTEATAPENAAADKAAAVGAMGTAMRSGAKH